MRLHITADAKGVRFDVYLDDDEDSVYDVEMQTVLRRNLPKRMRYYQGMMDLNLIERGAAYQDLNRSYIIFICLDNPYPDIGLHKYTFRTICSELPELILEDEAAKIILSADGDAADVSEEMTAFLRYLRGKEPTTGFTKRLAGNVQKAREHKRWRGEYMTLWEKFEDAREEGRKEGRKEGMTNTLIALVNKGLLTPKDAAEQAGIAEAEFMKKMSENK